jgi:hypothetical protein
MFIRRRRVAVTLVSSFLLAGGLIAGGVAASVPAAAAPAAAHPGARIRLPEVTIRLTNASQFCLNVTNNVDKNTQPLQIWTCSGAGDDHFYENTNTGCVEVVYCMNFEDIHNTGLCVEGPQTTGGNVALGACNGGRSAWYSTCLPGHLGNAFLGNSGNLSVSGPLQNGNQVYATYCTSPGGATWQNWSGY